MTVTRILALFAALALVEARSHNLQKREANTLCDRTVNNTNNVQCFCGPDTRNTNIIRSADCSVTNEHIKHDDPSWESFNQLRNYQKIILTNTRGIGLKYIPTNAFKHTSALTKLEIKYCEIDKIDAFAFANLSLIEELTLRDNQIQFLRANAFAHHSDLTTINLDKNNIVEINRDVFIDLPSLEKLFLTSNKITTIHDRAFVHLTNLKELEINMNSLFSLNSESFSGLMNLLKLDLSSNSLEVIGDNTFLPLTNLRSLNLESNKIQMLDEKAFNGLSRLLSLSLGHNKLSDIDNPKTFFGLENLSSLSLRGNDMRLLKNEVMSPILSNFYNLKSNLDVEDNKFPCECRLDWFMDLLNHSQSSNLKLAVENLKCYPDAKTREMWAKVDDTEKNTGQVFDEEESNTDYEYYDESLLNGRLFYFDVRYLLNCTPVITKAGSEVTIPETTATVPTTITTEMTITKINKPSQDVTTVTTKKIEPRIIESTRYETTPKIIQPTLKEVRSNRNEISRDKKDNLYTTSRLATVSAKPIENKNNMYEDGMASDEAKPDKLKSLRSIQEESKDTPTYKANSAHENIASVVLIYTLICTRLI